MILCMKVSSNKCTCRASIGCVASCIHMIAHYPLPMRLRASFFNFVFTSFLVVSALPSAGAAEGEGHFALQGFSFLNPMPRPVDRFEGRAQLEYNNRYVLAPTLAFRYHPFLQATSLPKAWEHQVITDPREMFFEYEDDGFFLRAGFLTLRWEGTDGLNPMDMAAMKDYGDPLNAPSKASAGVQMGVSSESVDIEAMWIPWQTRSSLPGDESAWWPRKITLPLRTDQYVLLLPERVDYEIDDRQTLDNALDHNYGARIQVRGVGADASVGFFEGAAEAPILRPVINTVPIELDPRLIFQMLSPVHIAPIDYRRRTVSAFVTKTLSQWILRGSTRYEQPLGSDPSLPSWSQQTVAGFERSFEFWGDSVTFIVQGSWMHRPEVSSLISFQDIFDRALLLGMRWPVGEKWLAFFSGLHSFRDESTLAQFELTRRWNDKVSSKLFVQTLSGPPESLLGNFADNDRVGLDLTYSF
jgi:hypothetical protein